MLQPRPSRADRCRTSRSPRRTLRPAPPCHPPPRGRSGTDAPAAASATTAAARRRQRRSVGETRPPPRPVPTRQPPVPERSGRDGRIHLVGDKQLVATLSPAASPPPRRTQVVVAVPGAALEEVLGPQGQMLKDVCRQTGALVNLRPDMACAEDGYVAAIVGSEDAMAAAEAWVRDLVALAEAAAAQGDLEPLDEERQEEPSEPCDEDAEDGVELQEDRAAMEEADGDAGLKRTADIEFPHYKSEVFLEMRAPGQQGINKHAALQKLKERFGLDELRFLGGSKEGGAPNTSVIRAEGDAQSVEDFAGECAERLARCEDFVMEQFPFDSSLAGKLGALFGGLLQQAPFCAAACRIEAACGVFLSVTRLDVDTHPGQGQKSVCIRGAAEAIERAKPMIVQLIADTGASAPTRRSDWKSDREQAGMKIKPEKIETMVNQFSEDTRASESRQARNRRLIQERMNEMNAKAAGKGRPST